MISSVLLGRIVAHAATTPDVEICGLIFGTSDMVDAVQPCANVASDPMMRFEIDPTSLIAAYRRARSGGPRITGHYHSHPSGHTVPSSCDAAMAGPDGALWLIVAGCDVGAWRAVEHGQVHGRFDPVSLVVLPCAPAPASPQDRR